MYPTLDTDYITIDCFNCDNGYCEIPNTGVFIDTILYHQTLVRSENKLL